MGSANESEKDDKKTENDSITSEIIVVPDSYTDPITKKIMKNPTMVLSSMSIYERTTIEKWMKSERGFDPLTGVPMSYGKWPILLEERPDIKYKIKEFVKQNPSFKSDIFDEKDTSIQWSTLFASYDDKIKEKYQQILDDQSSLRVKAKQLFKPCEDVKKADDGDIGVEYDESIVLRSDVPIVCVMGPSRNGKSTIVNDILGVKQATVTSSSPNVALTKGAWIGKYETNPKDYSNYGTVYKVQATQDIKKGEIDDTKDDETKDEGNEFYILDMEGVSHDVTNFTRRLFYACYATANVIVWNDKEVASDRFRILMKALKDEMKSVASSDSKPALLYLKRDAEDCICDPYQTLDEYMNKHESLEWFREMNIFSSISAYELNRPSIDKNNSKLLFNFHSKPENCQLLTPLIEKFIVLSKNAKRFSSNMYRLKQQIEHINKSTALSMTKELILNNEILRNFMIPPQNHANRRRDMAFVACAFSWNHKYLETQFDEEMNKMQELLSKTTEKNAKILKILAVNKEEIYQRVKNKTEFIPQENESFYKKSMLGGAVFAGTAACVVVMSGGATVPVLIAAMGMGGGSAAEAVVGGMMAGCALGLYGGIGYQWATGNYLKYSLGKTDKEIEDDKEEVTSKTPYCVWDDDDVYGMFN